jgi:peptide/nickel transport system permease protein
MTDPAVTGAFSSAPARWLREASAATLIGCVMLGLLVLLGLTAPLIATHDPLAINPAEQLRPPGAGHWFGTDRVGFDVFSRVVYAVRTDLTIAVVAVALSIGIGLPLGIVAGWLGRWVDEALMRALDVVQAFPPFILAIAVLAALGRGTDKIILVVGLVGVPYFMRLARTQVLMLKELPHVEAARSVGNRGFRLVWRYVVPGTLGLTAVQAAMSCGWAIIITAGLGFLGLGVPLPQPEWGTMITAGAEDIVNGRWWISFFPGLAVAFAGLGFNLVGEGLAYLFDPRRRGALR